jgi:hypothetical protein
MCSMPIYPKLGVGAAVEDAAQGHDAVVPGAVTRNVRNIIPRSRARSMRRNALRLIAPTVEKTGYYPCQMDGDVADLGL